MNARLDFFEPGAMVREHAVATKDTPSDYRSNPGLCLVIVHPPALFIGPAQSVALSVADITWCLVVVADAVLRRSSPPAGGAVDAGARPSERFASPHEDDSDVRVVALNG